MGYASSCCTGRTHLQELVTAAADVCGDLGIQPPLAASSKGGDMGPLFEQLLAATVEGVVPATPSLKVDRLSTMLIT